jgi:hypothetical protein
VSHEFYSRILYNVVCFEHGGALWRDEGCGLRKVLGENIRDCYGHAEHCRRRAKEQSDPLLRQDFLDCERRWLLLARGYELAERMEALSKAPAKRVKAAA